ncbi:MAG TPA: SAM-dependent methyltransferase [Actinophytocola sp.]|uniref:SAM-dependent methyltransferase n=1 Tax=Actinophytocola sp. TaxID=1872138 RepID=UPI002DDDAF4D|nr:SAM-dependent methyltransferase [Actinophytocola sp.]HEV2779468.1 SAM-dependent methyltransferase [Actinophytocola sp.]
MPSEPPYWLAPGVDVDRPNVARIYDYLLGGACNFQADRDFAEKLLAVIPEAEGAAQHNRAYLRRAVRFCVGEGIRQFLDLGSGIPTVGNVHEIAQQLAPECRVVYVDNEPIAVAHSELMLEGNDRTGVVLANLLDVDTVLTSEPVQQLLDFSEPMAILMVGVLHYIPDSADPWQAVARYVDAMSSGSHLAISHGALVEVQRSLDGWRMMSQSGNPGGGRPREQVEAFLTGTDLVAPGLVWTPEWRPDPGMEVANPELAFMWAAVGRKP